MPALLQRLPRHGCEPLSGNRWRACSSAAFPTDDGLRGDLPHAAHFMLIGTSHHKHTCAECAEICEECARDCERLEGMEECVKACRSCAESCRKMGA